MDQLQEQLMQRQAAPAVPAVDQQIQQRQGINSMMSKMAPGQPPVQAPPVLQQGPFSFQSKIPDIESLIKAMQRSGMTHSRTEDIELKPSIDSLLQRARQIPGM